MAKSDKVAAVAEIAEQFKGASAAVVTEYRGLSVPQISELRRSLGEGATYSVAKNTLTKLAAKEAGVEGLDELFSGPTAIAFIEGEPVVAAKAIKTFAKDNKALVIKGGYMDGRVLSIAVARCLQMIVVTGVTKYATASRITMSRRDASSCHIRMPISCRKLSRLGTASRGTSHSCAIASTSDSDRYGFPHAVSLSIVCNHVSGRSWCT